MKNTQHKALEQTAVTVEDMGLTKKAVKPQEAEVGHVQHQRQDDAVDAYYAVNAYMENAVDGFDAYTEHVVEGYTENAEVGNEVQEGGDIIIRRIKIYMNHKRAENVTGRDEIYIKAWGWPTGGLYNILRYDYKDIDVQAKFYNNEEVVSQPTTKSMVVYNNVVQYVAVKSAGAEVEDRLGHTRVSGTRDSSGYSIREEVLAEQLREQLGVFPPTRELRGGRAEGHDEVHHDGAEGYQVQERVPGRQDEEVSEDAEDPHLST